MKIFYNTRIASSTLLIVGATVEVGFKRPEKLYRDAQ
jgi:hypothetical protein